MCACPAIPKEGAVVAVIAVSYSNDWGSRVIGETVVTIVCGVHYRKILIVKYELIDPLRAIIGCQNVFRWLRSKRPAV